MTAQIDFTQYSNFVEALTSKPSDDFREFVSSVTRLTANIIDSKEGPTVNVPLLVTVAMGLPGEAGEFTEIVKKLVFHGKPLTDEVHAHMVKELGDVIFYWVNACRAIGVQPSDVIAKNVSKLESRYPGGKFDVWHAENRTPE